MNNLMFLLLLSTFLPLLRANVITIEDTGYKGIVVAIRNAISEDLELIENIKKLFTDASKFLHTVTRGKAYFKEVTISIPSTWSQQDKYEMVLADPFASAHIRIDVPNPEHGNSPYTLQPGGCGEPGQYIHLTSKFVKDTNGEITEEFGPPARQLIHEWAHLRYGVFDEYGISGDPRFPTFYLDSGKIRPTSCIKDIKGWIQSKNGGPCTIIEAGFVDKDCTFIPDMDYQDVAASIMYMPFIPTMNSFCDKSNERFHNVRAPTRQNSLCHYRTTWSVIAGHNDFKNNNRTKRQAIDFGPEFRLVRQQTSEDRRFVLVLDVSGSMNGRPIQLLHQAATRFVEDRIPDGSYLGIVQFSTFSKVLHTLTKVTNASRHELSSSLPKEDDSGTTAIGRGLEEGLKVLKNYTNNSVEGGMIILITDGEENVSPFIHQIMSSLEKEKIVVNTVAFGNHASQKLENLTKATGGKGFYFGDLQGTRPTSDLDAAFLESVTSQSDIDLQPVKISDEMIHIYDDNVQQKKVILDEEVGKNTIFTFLSTIVNGFDVRLTDPKGKMYDNSDVEFSADTVTRKRILVSIKNAESGEWLVEFRRTTHVPIIVSMSVTSEPKDVRKQPVRLRSWISDFQFQFPAYAKIYAEVKKGYNAVIGAKVLATVDRPVGKPVDIILKDDGVGADVLKNDGIYSAYFTHFNGNGRYAVVASVVNDGHAKLKTGSRSSSALPIPKFVKNTERPEKESSDSFSLDEFIMSNTTETEDDEEESEPLAALQRSSETGAFRVEAWTPKDSLPPGNITDLVTLPTSHGNKSAILRWTSPGDDLDNGIVSSIELRANPKPEVLLRNFDEAFLYTDKFLINGTLNPLPAGEIQTITVILPEFLVPKENDTWTMYFAVRAIDKNNNTSPGYNIAAANGVVINRKTVTENIHKESTNWWPIIIGIGAAILLMILLLVILIIVFKKKKSLKFERVYCD